MTIQDKKSATRAAGSARRGRDEQQPGPLDPGILGFVIETANEAVFIFNEQRHIIFANDMAARLSGYPLAELRGMHIHELDPGYPLASPALSRQRATQGDRLVLNPCIAPSPANCCRWKCRWSPRSSTASSTTALSCATSPWRKALREGEQRFRVIADTSPVALVICETGGGRIQYANNQAARMLHLPIAAMLKLAFIEALQAGGATSDLLLKLDAARRCRTRNSSCVTTSTSSGCR